MTGQKRLAICPGSFDPLTRGHEDIIWRATRIFDRVMVAVSHDPSHEKRQLFSPTERLEMIREVFADEPRIEAMAFQGLLMEFARTAGASAVVRGLRGVRDFDYEFQMALMNRRLEPSIETIFLAPEPDFSFVSSTLIREISTLGGSVDEFVSPAVAQRIDRLDS